MEEPMHPDESERAEQREQAAHAHELLKAARGMGHVPTLNLMSELWGALHAHNRSDEERAAVGSYVMRMSDVVEKFSGDGMREKLRRIERDVFADKKLVALLHDLRLHNEAVKELWHRSRGEVGEYNAVAARELVALQRDRALAIGDHVTAGILAKMHRTTVSDTLFVERPVELGAKKPRRNKLTTQKASDAYTAWLKLREKRPELTRAQAIKEYVKQTGRSEGAVNGMIRRREQILGLRPLTRHAK